MGGSMRLRVFVMLLFVLVILVSPVMFADGREELLYSDDWNNGVVVVLYGNQYGTGWWVNENYLITAGHVVNYESGAKVSIFHGDWTGNGVVVFVDRVHDIAVIRASTRPPHQYVFRLSVNPPEKGETIYVLGYPFELYRIVGNLQKVSYNPRVSMGIVSWVYSDRELFEFSATTDAGNSGGPIVNEAGDVVGLVSFALTGEAATLYYGTSVSAIKVDLDHIHVRYMVSLHSVLENSSSSLSFQPYIVASVVGAGAAILSMLVLYPMLRRR